MAGYSEKVIVFSGLMSLVALSIDLVLPGLDQIYQHFVLDDPNMRQWTITAVLIGLAVGQIFYGPLSDSIGRKPALIFGLCIYIIGAITSAMADSFAVMLAGRVLQGFGVAGPRVITVAIVRDLYGGVAMARLMSLLMALFVLVPVFAPSLGQVILLFIDWRGLFLSLVPVAAIGGIWFTLRISESLKSKRPFRLAPLGRGFLEVVRSPTTMGFTLAGGFGYGGLMSYILSAQQLFMDVYDKKETFGLWFGITALMVTFSMLVNRRLVTIYPLVLICQRALQIHIMIFVVVLLMVFLGKVTITFTVWMVFCMPSCFILGLTFPNYTSLAMEKMGHIAGMASGIIAAMMTIVAGLISFIIGGQFNNTALPIILGFGLCSLVALLIITLTKELAKPKSV